MHEYREPPRFSTLVIGETVYRPVIHYPPRDIESGWIASLRHSGMLDDFCVIALFLAGGGEVRIDDRILPITRGSLVTVDPTSSYDLFYAVEKGTVLNSLVFSLVDSEGAECKASMSQILSAWSGQAISLPSTPLMLAGDSIRECQEVMKSIAKHYLPGQKLRWLAVNCALHRLFEFLVLSSCEVSFGVEPSMTTVERIRHLIEDQFDQDLMLADLAAESNMSKQHLCRLFRKAFGTTPIAYQQELRMQHAAFLLTFSDRRITDIATICGFHSPFSFSRSFHRHHGVSPREFRSVAQREG